MPPKNNQSSLTTLIWLQIVAVTFSFQCASPKTNSVLLNRTKLFMSASRALQVADDAGFIYLYLSSANARK